MDYIENMSAAEKANELMALIGAENIEDFKVTVENEYGTPDKWDLSDEAFMNKARLCAMWNFEKTVVRARYIAAVMDLELYKDRDGIDGYGQGENVIFEFPKWVCYDTPETLRHYAEKLIHEYGHDYDDFLAKNGIVPGQLKSDVVAVYKDNFFNDHPEFIAITQGKDGKFYNKYGYDIKEGTSNTYYVPKGFDNLNDARNLVHQHCRSVVILYEDIMKTRYCRTSGSGRKYYNFADAVKASKEIAGNALYLVKTRNEYGADRIISDINLMDFPNSLRDGGRAYWCVDEVGSIGYTKDNGRVVYWDFEVLEPPAVRKQSGHTNISTPPAAKSYQNP